MGRIDKFSFFVGAFLVVLIIGCVAQVGEQTNLVGVVRFQYIGALQSTLPHKTVAFSILDTETGTINNWNTDGTVSVYDFR